MSVGVQIKKIARWTFLSLVSGVLVGVSSGLFLILLDLFTRLRKQNPQLIWGLPIAGLMIGGLYHFMGREIAHGNRRLLKEIHHPQKKLPFYMAPLILLTTLMTHLFGGSAGREGTAVQMGASLSDQLTGFLPFEPWERQVLLTAGAGAGFGAAIGAPWAGMVFGLEILRWSGRKSFLVAMSCLVASMTGYGVTVLMNAPHSHFPKVDIPLVDFKMLILVAVAGVAFGLCARVFNKTVSVTETLFTKFIAYPPLRPLIGGFCLLGFFWLEGSDRYAGLGVDVIQQTLDGATQLKDPFLKIGATALTIGSGFKGGEFIPLVFIGSTLGSVLALLLPIESGLLAALGFAAVFGAAAKVPLACAVMAMEIFGWEIGPYAIFVGWIAAFFSGSKGIYKNQ